MALYGLVLVSGAKQAPAWNLDELPFPQHGMVWYGMELPLPAVLARARISDRNRRWAEGAADSMLAASMRTRGGNQIFKNWRICDRQFRR